MVFTIDVGTLQPTIEINMPQTTTTGITTIQVTTGIIIKTTIETAHNVL